MKCCAMHLWKTVSHATSLIFKTLSLNRFAFVDIIIKLYFSVRYLISSIMGVS